MNVPRPRDKLPTPPPRNRYKCAYCGYTDSRYAFTGRDGMRCPKCGAPVIRTNSGKRA